MHLKVCLELSGPGRNPHCRLTFESVSGISLSSLFTEWGEIVSGAYALPMASDERKAHQDVANWSLSSMGIGALNGA